MADRKRLWSLARVALGLLLLALLVLSVDVRELLDALAGAAPLWLLLVFVFAHLGIVVSVLKWRWLLRAVGHQAGFGSLFGLYLIGTFFNNFLPSMVGGDAVRAYMLGKETGDTAEVLATTVVERVTGLAALVCLVPIGLLEPRIRESFPWVVPLVAGTALAFVVGLWLLLRFRSIPGFGELLRRIPQSRTTGFVRRTHASIETFQGHGGVLAACFVTSFFFYFLAMATVYSAVHCVGAEIDFGPLLIVVPIVMLIALLPISPNGIGVSEVGWVIFLGLFGVPQVAALAAALVLRLRSVFTSLLGGGLYAMARRRVPGRRQDSLGGETT